MFNHKCSCSSWLSKNCKLQQPRENAEKVAMFAQQGCSVAALAQVQKMKRNHPVADCLNCRMKRTNGVFACVCFLLFGSMNLRYGSKLSPQLDAVYCWKCQNFGGACFKCPSRSAHWTPGILGVGTYVLLEGDALWSFLGGMVLSSCVNLSWRKFHRWAAFRGTGINAPLSAALSAMSVPPHWSCTLERVMSLCQSASFPKDCVLFQAVLGIKHAHTIIPHVIPPELQSQDLVSGCLRMSSQLKFHPAEEYWSSYASSLCWTKNVCHSLLIHDAFGMLGGPRTQFQGHQWQRHLATWGACRSALRVATAENIDLCIAHLSMSIIQSAHTLL